MSFLIASGASSRIHDSHTAKTSKWLLWIKSSIRAPFLAALPAFRTPKRTADGPGFEAIVNNKNATHYVSNERVRCGRNGTQPGSRIHRTTGVVLYTLAHGIQRNTGANPTETLQFVVIQLNKY